MAAAAKKFLPFVLATLLLFWYVTIWAPYSRSSSTSQAQIVAEKASSASASNKQDPLERCVMLAFNSPSSTPAPGPLPVPGSTLAGSSEQGGGLEWEWILCKDLFRVVDIHRRVHGFLPGYYVRALEKAPRFKNEEAALHEFLCRLDPHNNYRGVPCPPT